MKNKEIKEKAEEFLKGKLINECNHISFNAWSKNGYRKSYKSSELMTLFVQSLEDSAIISKNLAELEQTKPKESGSVKGFIIPQDMNIKGFLQGIKDEEISIDNAYKVLTQFNKEEQGSVENWRLVDESYRKWCNEHKNYESQFAFEMGLKEGVKIANQQFNKPTVREGDYMKERRKLRSFMKFMMKKDLFKYMMIDYEQPEMFLESIGMYPLKRTK